MTTKTSLASASGAITDRHVYDSSGKFGPFKGQMIVAEQTFSLLQRVYLEKVNGVWQGAAFHFISGFGSGNIATLMIPDGVLYTGGSDRGWWRRLLFRPPDSIHRSAP
jgi:hypothetical protein